jgi:hypothetical protein
MAVLFAHRLRGDKAVAEARGKVLDRGLSRLRIAPCRLRHGHPGRHRAVSRCKSRCFSRNGAPQAKARRAAFSAGSPILRVRDTVRAGRQSRAVSLVQRPAAHHDDDAALPFEEGRKLAAAIPGARFVPLDGRNYVILENDPSWHRFLHEISEFVRG